MMRLWLVVTVANRLTAISRYGAPAHCVHARLGP
jgi:hypothetical protein